MLVLLGDADGREWPEAERWQMARCSAPSPSSCRRCSRTRRPAGRHVDPARDGDARAGGHDDEPRGTRAAAAPGAHAARRRADLGSSRSWRAARRRQLEAPLPTPRAGRSAAGSPPPARRWRELGGDRRCRRAAACAGEGLRRRPRPRGRRRRPSPAGCAIVATGRSSRGRPSSARRAPRLQQPAPWVMLAHVDAVRLGLAEGSSVVVAAHAGGRTPGRCRTSRTLRGGRRARSTGRAPRCRAPRTVGQRLRRARRLHPSRPSRRSRSSTC